MILFDETIKQATSDGTPFPEVLKKNGILVGIKVDAGAVDLAHALKKNNRRAGWPARAVSRIPQARRHIRQVARGHHDRSRHPERFLHAANAHALARYAGLCQEAGLVPIVEPEVLMDGDHTIERSFEVTERTLHAVFHELYQQRVARLEHAVLKASMVISRSARNRAEHRAGGPSHGRVPQTHGPTAMPGRTWFLSGGQSEELATAHLNAMNKLGALARVRLSTFHMAARLQAPVLIEWKVTHVTATAQRRLYPPRETPNSAACYGRYRPRWR